MPMQLPQPSSSANPDLPLSEDVMLLDVAASPPITRLKSGAWSTFLSTFITIFFAEMGDKTQLATLLLSAQSQSPWVVFAGAGSALIATSLVGVLLGRFLAKVLSPKTLDIAAGGLLAIVAVLLLWDTVHL
jgi:Ca2+/H+ antiporter, TMEM165/GDT1 family